MKATKQQKNASKIPVKIERLTQKWKSMLPEAGKRGGGESRGKSEKRLKLISIFKSEFYNIYRRYRLQIADTR